MSIVKLYFLVMRISCRKQIKKLKKKVSENKVKTLKMCIYFNSELTYKFYKTLFSAFGITVYSTSNNSETKRKQSMKTG